ncbi:hypothetical protein [Methanobrevibacter sp.]|uniref:hypothetical protein n=1 Tax=Methanobrevibacter sp. TaxID=66852 RepID=UPI00388DC0E2
MLLREKIAYIILLLVLLTVVVNLSSINNFLAFQTDKTLEFDHSIYVVPHHWNTTDELNISGKTPLAMTNGYIVFDAWDDWPEDHITSISEAKFRAMEDGGYKVLKNENETQSGVKVSKQYFSNPSLDTDKIWKHVGVNYVFPKQDTNYAIQVHYFTTHDYHNKSYVKEIDDRIEDMMATMENKNYNWYISTFNKLMNNETVEWDIL